MTISISGREGGSEDCPTRLVYTVSERIPNHQSVLTCRIIQPENVCHQTPDNHSIPINVLVDRTKRIREAKSEAQKEIEEYRKQKEEEFKKFEAEV